MNILRQLAGMALWVDKAGLFFIRTILTPFSYPLKGGEQPSVKKKMYKAAVLLKIMG